MPTSEKLDRENARQSPPSEASRDDKAEDQKWAIDPAWAVTREQAEVGKAASEAAARGEFLPDIDNWDLSFYTVGDAVFVGCQRQPDLWTAFQAENDVDAKRALLRQLFKVGQKYLSAQAQPEYSPSSPKQAAAADPVEQDSFLIHNGTPYMPLADAARHAGVHRETLLTWMKNEVAFAGEPIESLYLKPTGTHFISRRSVERIVNRFEKWPSAQNAPGPITLGQTEQGAGYLSVSEAARIIGMADVTLRKWVRQGTAPLERPLDVIRDTSSGYFYIKHQDVLQLAKYVKEFGLSRGGRPLASPALH